MAQRTYDIRLKGTLDFSQPKQGIKQYVTDTRRSASQASQSWDGVNATLRGHAQVIATASTALKGYFAILAAQSAPRALKDYADTWADVRHQLQLATSDAQSLHRAQDTVYQIALKSHQSLNGISDVYQSIVRSTEQYNLSSRDSARLVETIAKSLTLSGLSADQSASQIRRLALGLANGELKSRDLRQVLRDMPGLAQALADGLGVSNHALAKMAEDGELSAQAVVSALVGAADAVDERFGKMSNMAGDAFTDLRTKAIRYVGTLAESSDASGKLGAALGVLGDHLNVVGGLMGGMITYKVAQVLGSATVATGKYTVALYQNVVGLKARVVAENAARVADVEATAATAARARASVDSKQRLLGVAQAERTAAAAALNTAAKQMDAAKGTAAHSAAVRAHAAALKNDAIATDELVLAETALARAEGRTTAATLAHTAAQKAATTQTTVLRAATRGVMSMLGGGVGLVALVASAAAGWLLFRDNTDEAAESLTDLSLPLDEAIKKFRELGEAQRIVAQLKLADDIEEQGKALRKAFAQFGGFAQTGFRGDANVTAQIDAVAKLRQQLMSGKLTADEASQAVQGFIDKTARLQGTDTFRRGMQEAAAQIETAMQKTKAYQDRADALAKAQKDVAGSTQAATATIASQGATAAAASGDWDKYLAKLEQGVQQAGLTGAALVRMQVAAKGFSPDQVKLAGNLSQQQTLLGQYQAAIAKGDKAQADSIAKTLTGLTETEVALRRVMALADGGKSIAEAASKAIDAGEYAKAGKTLLNVLLGNDDEARAKAEATLKAQLKAIRDSVEPSTHGGGSQTVSDQAKALAATQQRIDQQKLLLLAMDRSGVAALSMTEADKQVLALTEALSTETDKRKQALLEAQLAKAKDLQQTEQDVAAKRQQLQLTQMQTAAVKELTRNAADRERQHAREIAAVGQGDQERTRNQRLQAIDDEYRQRRQRYYDKGHEPGATWDETKAQAYFAQLEQLRAADIASENRYQKQLDAARSDVGKGMTRAFANYVEQAANLAGQMDNVFSRAFSGMEDAIVQFVTTGKGSFKDLANSIIADLVRMETRILVSKALQSVMGYFMGGSTGAGGGAGIDWAAGAGSWGNYPVSANANGGVYRSPGLSAYSGSIVSQPTLFKFAHGAGLMGEAGPEAIIPLSRGANGKLGVQASGAGDVEVIVNITNRGEPVQARQTGSRRDGKKVMVDMILDTVAGDMASGGKTAKAAAGRFGLQRRGVAVGG